MTKILNSLFHLMEWEQSQFQDKEVLATIMKMTTSKTKILKTSLAKHYLRYLMLRTVISMDRLKLLDYHLKEAYQKLFLVDKMIFL